MDNEVKDMLVKILEGQSRLEVKVNGLDEKVTGLDEKVTGIEKEVKESVDVMKDVIGRHQIDIEILKRRPV